MQIEIPQSEQDILARQATAAGYDDVERYVTEQVRALVYQPSPEEIAENVAKLESADASIDAGQGIDAEDAFRSIAEKHGFKLPQ